MSSDLNDKSELSFYKNNIFMLSKAMQNDNFIELLYIKKRWGARVVDWACLENRYARKGIGGSNPPPTA